MITKNKNKKTSMDILRKMSIIPVAMIALYAFSIRPTDMPVITSQSIHGSALQNPWTPQNEMEEQIIVVGYANKNVSLKKDVMVTSESERVKASGTFSYNEVETKPVFQGSIQNFYKYFREGDLSCQRSREWNYG